jgi:hypothetical protein
VFLVFRKLAFLVFDRVTNTFLGSVIIKTNKCREVDELICLPAPGTTCISPIGCHTTLTKCFTDYFNILHISARNYMCSLMMMIDRSKHVGAF